MVAKLIEGGEKLQAYLENLMRVLGQPGTLSVGFFENATYPDGTPVAQVAFWQEFGTKKIPPRPFFRNMIAKQSPGWGALMGRTLVKCQYDVEAALQMFGQFMVEDLQQSIIDLHEPPLAPLTLMLRKMKDEDPLLVVTGATLAEAMDRVRAGEEGATGTRAKPLEDTKVMLHSPGAHVEMGVLP